MQLDAGLNIKLFKRRISCMSIVLSFISGNCHATFPCNFIRQLSCNFSMELYQATFMQLFQATFMQLFHGTLSGNFHATFPGNFIRQLSCNFHATFRLSPFWCMQDNYYVQNSGCGWVGEFNQATFMQLFQATLSGNFHATFPGNFHATFRLSPFCCMQDNYYVQNSGCWWVGEFNRLARCKLLLTVTEGA